MRLFLVFRHVTSHKCLEEFSEIQRHKFGDSCLRYYACCKMITIVKIMSVRFGVKEHILGAAVLQAPVATSLSSSEVELFETEFIHYEKKYVKENHQTSFLFIIP